MAHDVFISYSSKDKLTADAICHALEQNGVKCWIAPGSVRPGFDYPSEILFGIENCKLMVLLFSEESNKSPFVYAEVERAFSKSKMIIPYRLSQIEMNRNLELLLAGKHWIDAYPDDTVFADLMAAVKNALGMPAAQVSVSASDQRQELRIAQELKTPVVSASTFNGGQNYAVGDTITFGDYDWLVLDVQEDKALIISKDCVTLKKIKCNPHPGYVNHPYSGSNLREYVDGEFYNNFSADEQSRVVYPTKINEYGSTLYEHVFLLSVDEAKKYFINDDEREAYYNKQPTFWWLRSNGDNASRISYVSQGLDAHMKSQGLGPGNGGEINEYGLPIDCTVSGGVRPAMWVKLEGLTLAAQQNSESIPNENTEEEWFLQLFSQISKEDDCVVYTTDLNTLGNFYTIYLFYPNGALVTIGGLDIKNDSIQSVIERADEIELSYADGQYTLEGNTINHSLKYKNTFNQIDFSGNFNEHGQILWRNLSFGTDYTGIIYPCGVFINGKFIERD
ncbi:MAG: toll/interleukin-1 receptor domain-containing protein [Oscillospiraceae bacterium]|nr:toll/interleukin-1 receptor domain-containing protein [Oscillospiraceae bacterium]